MYSVWKCWIRRKTFRIELKLINLFPQSRLEFAFPQLNRAGFGTV